MLSLLVLLVPAAALFYYADLADPVQYATVTPQSGTTAVIGNLDMHSASLVRSGQVHLVISGSISDPTVSQLRLLTRSPGGAGWQPQPGCCAISGQEFAGAAVLGSPRAPMTGTQIVAFQLVSGAGATETQGTIAVTIDSFPGGSKLAYNVVGILGVLAILIAPVQWLAAPPGPRRARARDGTGQAGAVPAATVKRQEKNHAR